MVVEDKIAQNGYGTTYDEIVVSTTVTESDDPFLGELQPLLEPVTGLWDDDDDDIFTRYKVTVRCTGKIMGGVPQKAEMIEGWLRTRLQGGDDEVKQAMFDTLEKLGVDPGNQPTIEELRLAAKAFASENHGNTFFRDENGLYISDFQLKAMLKENCNILFADQRWGKTKKGPKAFLSERVFVDEPRVYLGVHRPSGKHLQVGHVSGPKGMRSTLTYYDYVAQPTMTFTVSSLRDEITPEQWKAILVASQRNGVGAIRSMSHGQFKVLQFDKVV